MAFECAFAPADYGVGMGGGGGGLDADEEPARGDAEYLESVKRGSVGGAGRLERVRLEGDHLYLGDLECFGGHLERSGAL